MKIQPARADRFIKAPGDEVVAVLLYGPDDGLVRERAETLVRAVAGSLDDPFLVADVAPATCATIRRDWPTRRARSPSAADGGRCACVVPRDAVSEAVKNALATLSDGDGPSPSLVVVEAGELAPRAKLRKLFEEAARAAAVACYLDDGRNLAQVIARDPRQPQAQARARRPRLAHPASRRRPARDALGARQARALLLRPQRGHGRGLRRGDRRCLGERSRPGDLRRHRR